MLATNYFKVALLPSGEGTSLSIGEENVKLGIKFCTGVLITVNFIFIVHIAIIITDYA